MLIRAWLRMQARSVHDGHLARWRTGISSSQTAAIDIPLRRNLPRGTSEEVEIRPLQPDRWTHVKTGDVLAMVVGDESVGEATVLCVREPRRWRR